MKFIFKPHAAKTIEMQVFAGSMIVGMRQDGVRPSEVFLDKEDLKALVAIPEAELKSYLQRVLWALK